jgi:hypothetical protein
MIRIALRGHNVRFTTTIKTAVAIAHSVQLNTIWIATGATRSDVPTPKTLARRNPGQSNRRARAGGVTKKSAAGIAMERATKSERRFLTANTVRSSDVGFQITADNRPCVSLSRIWNSLGDQGCGNAIGTRCAMPGMVMGRWPRAGISPKRNLAALSSETWALEKVQT